MATKIAEPIFVDNSNICKECRRNLPPYYKDEICPVCKERILFSNVKEFIRENDVNELDVSKHFNIPLFKVKGWIREGRIEYKELQQPKIESLHCQSCGKSITFGSLCSECLRKTNISGGASYSFDDAEDERFRFFQK